MKTEGLINTALLLTHPRLALQYRKLFGRWPKVAVPRSVNDKYLWRKIVDRDPRFVTLSDKLATKQLMAEKHPEIRTAKVLWQGTDIREAPQHLLSSPAFLKANHASGFNLRLGGEDNAPNLVELHRKTQLWLATRWERYHGEWGYSGVSARLFIEEDLTLPDGNGNLDLTLYAFSDRISHLAVMLNHKTALTHVARFDEHGNRLAIPTPANPGQKPPSNTAPPGDTAILPMDYRLPKGTLAMAEKARDIARDFDHLRVDFLWNGRKWFLTELTLYSMGGYIVYSDQELLERMNMCWDLQHSWPLRQPQRGWRADYTRWLKRQLAI